MMSTVIIICLHDNPCSHFGSNFAEERRVVALNPRNQAGGRSQTSETEVDSCVESRLTELGARIHAVLKTLRHNKSIASQNNRRSVGEN